MKLLQIDLPSQSPWGEELTEAFAGLAGMIAGTPGLLWKIRTESSVAHEAGGIYLFADEESLDRYLKEHTERLRAFGIDGIRALKLDAACRTPDKDRGTTAPGRPLPRPERRVGAAG
jgi:hypothetical protein